MGKCAVCAANHTFISSDVECGECPKNKILNKNSTCELCTSTNIPRPDLNGNKVCRPCPTTQIYYNQECHSCPVGFETKSGSGFEVDLDGRRVSTSRTKCIECPAGKYGTTRGTCVGCPIGTTTKINAQTECNVCTQGYGWNGTTCEHCLDIVENGIAIHLNNFSPTTSKQPCIPGLCNNTKHFTMPLTVSTNIVKAGWQPNPNPNTDNYLVCDYCPTGKYTTADIHVCLDIEPGFHLNKEGLNSPCPVDSYQDEFGKDKCKSCDFQRKSIINDKGKIEMNRPRID